MESNLLLIKCVTLAYLEFQAENTVNSKNLCREIVDGVNVPESSVEMASDADVIISLRSLVLWVLGQAENRELDKTQFLQRLRVATKSKTYLYDAVVDVINEEKETELKKNVIQYRRVLNEHLKSTKLKKLFKDTYYKSNGGDVTDYTELAREVNLGLEEYITKGIDEQHPCIVGKVNFDNDEEIRMQLTRSNKEVSSEGILKTGYQAINRMLGNQGGFRRGEFVLIGALQYNYKTGYTLNLFKHMALYNKPFMIDEKKKPLLMHISLENDLHLNVMQLYVSIYENETGQKCDIDNINIDEATEYVKEKLSVNGYTVVMTRLEPNLTSYQEIIDLMNEYEVKGYEIHGVVCDYLNMCNKKGLDRNGPMGTEIRELIRRIRNHTASRSITFVTPHQLSTEAKMLMRQGIDNFAQEVASKGYWDGSKQIDQEVDVEMIVHIEKVKGVGSYLTVARGKHRKVDITEEKHLTCILPFHDVGAVRDDVNGEDLSVKSIGSAPGGEDWLNGG